MEEVWPRGRLARWNLGPVRIMAIHADLAFHWAGGSVPIASGSAVGSSFPIAIGRPMATATKRRAINQFNLPPVAGLQQFQVLLVVAVEAVVVTVMRSVPHYDVLVFLRDDEIVLRVEPQNRRLALFMAGIAIKVRQVGFGPNQFGIGLTNRGGFKELGIDQRNLLERWRARAETRHELKGQGEEYNRQD